MGANKTGEENGTPRCRKKNFDEILRKSRNDYGRNQLGFCVRTAVKKMQTTSIYMYIASLRVTKREVEIGLWLR
jgi:hypothetical protein